MVMVTQRAKEVLHALKWAKGFHRPEVGLRLAPGAAGWELFADTEKAGDQVEQHEGSKVLLVGEELSPVVAGKTLDYLATDEGAQLVLASPGGRNGRRGGEDRYLQ